MNILLYTYQTRGKYILKNTSWQKRYPPGYIPPPHEKVHLSQLPDVDDKSHYQS